MLSMTAKVEDENLPSKIQAMMRTNKRFLTSVIKPSVVWIRVRLQRKKKENTRRRNWRKCATHHYPIISKL